MRTLLEKLAGNSCEKRTSDALFWWLLAASALRLTPGVSGVSASHARLRSARLLQDTVLGSASVTGVSSVLWRFVSRFAGSTTPGFWPARLRKPSSSRARRSDRSRALERALVEAQDDRPFLRSYCLDRTEGKGAASPWEDGAPANDDLVWVVGVALVAHVVEPTEVCPVACHHLVAVGSGEEATEFRLPSPALLATLIADLLCHGNEA
jgi:hypothetical protein